MSGPVLAMAIENAEFLIGEGLAELIGRKASVADVLDFCTQWRRRAIAALLLRGNPDDALRELSYSGRAFLYALQSPAVRRAAGEQVPFFDALAAGDLECASFIAQDCPPAWNRTEELEEDYLFFAGLMSLLQGKRDAAAALVARYQAIVGDDEEPRLSVLGALVASDADGFKESLTARMAELAARYHALVQKGAIADDEAETEGRVSTEGLALVRLARHLGLEVSPPGRMMPPLIWRATWRPPAGADEWIRKSDAG